jgi:hypothetical protein
MSEQQYIVDVKNGAGWRRYEALRILVSVGQAYHNGTKLQAVIDWVNKNTNQLQAVQIAVNDLLQGWNALANGVGGGKAFYDAEKNGDEWLKQHDGMLQSFKVASVTITRWGFWLEHPNYPITEQRLAELIADTENGLKDSIRLASEQILERRLKHTDVPNKDRFLDYSRQFIKEEIVVLALMHNEPVIHQQPNVKAADVYPGSILPCMDWFRNPTRVLPDELVSLRDRYFCRVDFHRPKIVRDASTLGLSGRNGNLVVAKVA